VAIATAPGMGGVGIVRLSGENAASIGAQLFSKRLVARQMVLGDFLDDQGQAVDQGLAVLFRAPHSFTGEHVVEFHGHGGPVVLRMLVQACLILGARLAAPGEFTQRAFINNKIDLAQAEAVADLIASRSATAARSALRSLQGVFSDQVHQLADELRTLRLFVEATLDFPDEEDVDRGAEFGLTERLDGIVSQLAQLLQNTRSAALMTEGITVALLGAPNAGKSSLLNALSGEDRAIVTEIPGTTRDLLPVDLDLDGLPIRLVDTAGLRDTPDKIEQQGVSRALNQAHQADLLLLVIDAAEIVDRANFDLTERSLRTLSGLDQDLALNPERLIVVFSKQDTLTEPGLLTSVKRRSGFATVATSAHTGDGLLELKEAIKLTVGVGVSADSNSYTARQRHVEALQDANAILQRAHQLAQIAQDGGVLLAEELRLAHDALGRIVGHTSPDDLLGDIFQNFCIGK